MTDGAMVMIVGDTVRVRITGGDFRGRFALLRAKKSLPVARLLDGWSVQFLHNGAYTVLGSSSLERVCGHAVGRLVCRLVPYHTGKCRLVSIDGGPQVIGKYGEGSANVTLTTPPPTPQEEPKLPPPLPQLPVDKFPPIDYPVRACSFCGWLFIRITPMVEDKGCPRCNPKGNPNLRTTAHAIQEMLP